MYLPILPHLQSLWGVPLKAVNLTLIFFYNGYSFSLFIYGPLSDRYGRRPLLLAGIAVFIGGSALCASSNSVETLTLGRFFQGIGAGGPSALGLALIKDIYKGPAQTKMMAVAGALVPLAPMSGPLLGSTTLLIGSWRLIFVLQIIIACAALIGVVLLQEPLKNKETGPLKNITVPYLALSKNFRFNLFNVLFATAQWPVFAFIAVSANIYILQFKTSEQTYSLYFAINFAAMMLGSFLCIKLLTWLKEPTVLLLGFGGLLLSGAALYFAPAGHQFYFTAVMFLITLFFGSTRPSSFSMILSTAKRYTGTASSMIMFANFMVGSMATWIISLEWQNSISVIGALAVSSSLPALAILFFLNYRGKTLSEVRVE